MVFLPNHNYAFGMCMYFFKKIIKRMLSYLRRERKKKKKKKRERQSDGLIGEKEVSSCQWIP